MLEDLGWITATPDGNGRKEYVVSPEGRQQLDVQQAEVNRVLTHIDHHKSRAHARRIPEIVRAMENLKTALRMRLGDDIPEPALTRRISEIIDRAAVEIERIEQEGIAMRNHQYTITVENDATNESGAPQRLQFRIEAHDEILALVERSRQRGDFDTDTAAAFTVGLKLLGEVMLKNRSHPLFEEFSPQFGQFMKRLKAGKGQPSAS